MVTKGKSKANQCEAEAEQELSREVAGGQCSSRVCPAREQLGWFSTRGDVGPHQQVCGVLCFVTRKFMEGLHSNFLRRDNWTPLGWESFILGNLSSFLLSFWHRQFDCSWFMHLKSWASIATVVSPGMAAAARREWTGKKEPDLVINCMTAFVKEERQERGIFLWAFF